MVMMLPRGAASEHGIVMTFGWRRDRSAKPRIAQSSAAIGIAALAALTVLAGSAPTAAEDAEVAHRRAIERKTFSNTKKATIPARITTAKKLRDLTSNG